MSYSIYAYLDPKALDADIPWLDEYMEKYPWSKKVNENNEVFIFVKPRYYIGMERFFLFMETLCQLHSMEFLISICDDNETNENLLDKLKTSGFEKLISFVKQH